jgi:tRNA G18 (ribose-2'-O)-methylase SpoU
VVAFIYNDSESKRSKVEKVTSIKDERVVLARRLKSRTGREGSGLVLLEGLEIINWVLENNWQTDYLFIEENSVDLLSQLSRPVGTIEYLRKQGFQIITTSPYGSTIQSLVELDSRPIALVIGNETTGVSEELLKAADKSILIPMDSGVESLNVGVAAGISIY